MSQSHDVCAPVFHWHVTRHRVERKGPDAAAAAVIVEVPDCVTQLAPPDAANARPQLPCDDIVARPLSTGLLPGCAASPPAVPVQLLRVRDNHACSGMVTLTTVTGLPTAVTAAAAAALVLSGIGARVWRGQAGLLASADGMLSSATTVARQTAVVLALLHGPCSCFFHPPPKSFPFETRVPAASLGFSTGAQHLGQRHSTVNTVPCVP